MRQALYRVRLFIDGMHANEQSDATMVFDEFIPQELRIASPKNGSSNFLVKPA
jgi:hypothetical protein